MRDRSDAVVIYAGGAAAIVAAVWFKQLLAGGKQFVIDFCAGGVAGALAKTLTRPIENCKQALQCQEIHPEVKAGRIRRYSGIKDYFRTTVKTRGVLALWEGNTISILRYFPTQVRNTLGSRLNQSSSLRLTTHACSPRRSISSSRTRSRASSQGTMPPQTLRDFFWPIWPQAASREPSR